MHTKEIPGPIYAGGAVLAMLAGCVNAVGLISLEHQALSHMTGMTTYLGIYLGTDQGDQVIRAIAIITSFFFGAMASGFVLRQSSLLIGRRYGAILSAESVLLLLATHYLNHNLFAGYCFASMACGLQNGMVSTYSGSVVRTTHVTGMVTDMGIAFGQALRGRTVEWTRFGLYGVLYAGFLSGGVLGAVGYTYLGFDTLLIPAALAGCTGLAHAFVKHLQHRRRRGRKLAEAFAMAGGGAARRRGA